MSTDRPAGRPRQRNTTAPPSDTVWLTSSRALFAGARHVRIEHNNEVYHLRITANDKLILTK